MTYLKHNFFIKVNKDKTREIEVKGKIICSYCKKRIKFNENVLCCNSGGYIFHYGCDVRLSGICPVQKINGLTNHTHIFGKLIKIKEVKKNGNNKKKGVLDLS
jgi:hypothetical protein